MQQSLALLNAKNVAFNVPFFMSLMAEAHARTGDLRSALALCRDAQERAQLTEEYLWLAEMHRIEGEVRRAAGHPLTDVEECFGRALDVSRRQGAKMFELRAATAPARLWRDQGRNVEARDLLPFIYEGFDTIDLKGAKTLLAELSA
jgi:predicted ATPase